MEKKISTLNVDNQKVDELRPLLRKNGIKPTKESVIDVAMSIAISVWKYADELTFFNLTNKKK